MSSSDVLYRVHTGKFIPSKLVWSLTTVFCHTQKCPCLGHDNRHARQSHHLYVLCGVLVHGLCNLQLGLLATGWKALQHQVRAAPVLLVLDFYL